MYSQFNQLSLSTNQFDTSSVTGTKFAIKPGRREARKSGRLFDRHSQHGGAAEVIKTGHFIVVIILQASFVIAVIKAPTGRFVPFGCHHNRMTSTQRKLQHKVIGTETQINNQSEGH